jgi:hypothetical protein
MMDPQRYVIHAKQWPQQIPAVLFVELPDGRTARRTFELPFLPRPGDELAVGWGGDYMTVSQVFWSPDEGVGVWFRTEPHMTFEKVSSAHWELEHDGRRHATAAAAGATQ